MAKKAAKQSKTEVAIYKRPMPTAELLDQDNLNPLFVPDPYIKQWAIENYLQDEGAFYNQEHEHLFHAEIGFLWTNVSNYRSGNMVAAQCEIFRVQGGKWTKARAEMQMRQWFGGIPNFIITINAFYAATATSASFCALIDHELYHAAQLVYPDGELAYDIDGNPKWMLRGHDVEEFVGVVERWGAGVAAGRTADLVKAASRKPLIAEADIVLACGNCLR